MTSSELRQALSDRAPESLTDRELLAGLLSFVQRGDAEATAGRLIGTFGSLAEVFRQEAWRLRAEGLGESAATFCRMILPAWGRARLSEFPRDFVFDSTEKLGRYFTAVFCGEAIEKVYLLLLREDRSYLSLKLVSTGSVNSANLNTRAIVEAALFAGARYAALAHNHPGGNPTPSACDIATTASLRSAFESAGIGLVEHIVTAGERYAPILLSCDGILREMPTDFPMVFGDTEDSGSR